MEEQVAAGISPLIISRVSRVIIYSTLKTAYRRSKDIKEEKINSISSISAKRESNAN